MIPIIKILYLLVVCCFSLVALFVVYHITRYSLDRKSAIFQTILFLSVFGVLLFANIIFFSNLPLEQLTAILSQ